jgi:hypothetical protein
VETQSSLFLSFRTDYIFWEDVKTTLVSEIPSLTRTKGVNSYRPVILLLKILEVCCVG